MKAKMQQQLCVCACVLDLLMYMPVTDISTIAQLDKN